MKSNIGIIIVTFNRLIFLKICLCRILAQTKEPSEILVVDNCSTDGTGEYLASFNDITKIFLKENMGPAGGYHEGIKYFSENTNVDYVWVMDDDFFPFSSCLEILLNHADDTKILFPFSRQKDFALRKDCGWSGVLIPMQIIKTVGYPKKEFFFWSEDSEYLLYRIREKWNFRAEWIQAAKAVHFTERTRNHRKPWKYYYEVRNMLFMRLYVKEKTSRRFYKMLRSWGFLLGAIFFRDDEKLAKFRFFMLGTYHGITKKMGKRIEPGTGKKIKVN